MTQDQFYNKHFEEYKEKLYEAVKDEYSLLDIFKKNKSKYPKPMVLTFCPLHWIRLLEFHCDLSLLLFPQIRYMRRFFYFHDPFGS